MSSWRLGGKFAEKSLQTNKNQEDHHKNKQKKRSHTHK